MKKNKIWFVTGASKGMGYELVSQLLQQGYYVTATSRNVTSLVEQFGGQSEQFLPLAMNLTDENDVRNCIEKAIQYFGELHIVVNNAGYGQYGYVEEVTDAEAHANFEINVFGLLHVLRYTIGQLRNQGYGHIINITSKGGFHAGAGTGIYCASKYAAEGLTEALYFEMKNFNINVTAVKPGGFRTNFLNADSLMLTNNPLEPYRLLHEEEHQMRQSYIGNQPGNPKKAAAALIEIAKSSNPPLHLFLGSDAYNSAAKKFKEVTYDMENWKDLGLSTDY